MSWKSWPLPLTVAAALAILTMVAFDNAGPGPTNNVRNSLVDPSAYERLRTGDLIFRRGTDLVSDAVLAAGNASRFSHVGILLVQKDKPYVVHAVPAETEGAPDSVVMESLEEFAKPERAREVSVFRVKGLALRRVPEVDELLRQAVGKPFDSQFDLSTNDRLYCTELVWDIYRRAGVNLVGRFDKLVLPFFDRDVILPDSLIGPRLSKVY